MVTRYDEVKLDAPKRTPQGGLRVPAHLTRSGIFVYRKDGKEVREYRPPEEVFRADALSSLAGAPVTLRHPFTRKGSPFLDPSTYRDHAVGHVGDEVKQDGDKVAGVVYVQDAEAIAAVEKLGLRQVSCGYRCRMDESSGVVPEGQRDAGQHYDRVQRDITYNHLALEPRGRAGADIALRLDADDNEYPEEKQMTKERIDAVDYEVGTDAHKAAVVRRDAAEKASSDERDKLQARADSAEAKAKKLETELAEAPTKLAQAAAARSSLENGARAVLGESAKFDGLTDAEIRLAVVKKSNPEMKIEGKSDAYIEALHDIAVVTSAKESSAHAVVRAAASNSARVDATDAEDEYPNPALARAAMIDRNRGIKPQA